MRSYQGMFDGTNVRDGSFPHEAFTSDGSGGAFAGKIKTISGGAVDIGKPASPTWEQAAIAVLEGSGQGQVRRVANAKGSVYSVDRQWDVPVREAAARFVQLARNTDTRNFLPTHSRVLRFTCILALLASTDVLKCSFFSQLDETSVITIVPYVGKVLMQGNDVRNTTTVQIFGCGFDSVYAGNRLTHLYSTKTIHPGGLFVFALDYSGGTQPNFNFELISNTMDVSMMLQQFCKFCNAIELLVALHSSSCSMHGVDIVSAFREIGHTRSGNPA